MERLPFLQLLVNMTAIIQPINFHVNCLLGLNSLSFAPSTHFVTVVSGVVGQITATETRFESATGHESIHSYSCMCRDSAIQLEDR